MITHEITMNDGEHVAETVILLTGKTIKAVVQELGFFNDNYIAKYDNHKLVWKGNCGMEY